MNIKEIVEFEKEISQLFLEIQKGKIIFWLSVEVLTKMQIKIKLAEKLPLEV